VLVLGNPPYTRHQSLTANQKAEAAKLSGDLVSSTLAGLSAYFLAVTLRHLRADDSLVMLLPSNWLSTRYAQEIRAHLWSLRSRLTELHVFPTELAVFPGTQVAAVILAVGPRRPQRQPFVVSSAHLTATAVEMAAERELDRSETMPQDFSRLNPADGEIRPLARPSRGRTPRLLGDAVLVRRGVATGANAYFFLPDLERSALPSDATAPAIVRLRGFEGRVLTPAAHDALGATGARRWLVDFHAYRTYCRSGLPASLGQFVSGLERAGIDRRHLLAVRGERWWVPELVHPAHLLIGPMTKGAFRILRNEVEAVHSNTLYGLTVRDADPALIPTLHAWLESDEGQRLLTSAARRHATGLLKLEPRALKMVELATWPPLAG
jgi:hypothetical protein